MYAQLLATEPCKLFFPNNYQEVDWEQSMDGHQHYLGEHRGSYISAHVLLNLLNELGKRDKMRGLPSIYLFFATSLINSIIQEHEC